MELDVHDPEMLFHHCLDPNTLRGVGSVRGSTPHYNRQGVPSRGGGPSV